MDRIYLIQREYVESKHDPDGVLLYHLLQQYARRYCDEVFKYDNFACPSTLIRNATKKGMKIIPVGDLEFVKTGILQIYGKDAAMRPIEVPESLRHHCHREYQIRKGKDIPQNLLYSPDMDEWFIKDADILKGFNNALCIGSCANHIIPEKRYVVSEKVNILSEYRVFMWKNEICAIQNYSGRPDIFPHEMEIRNMIKDYQEMRPDAYTLDIAVISKGYALNTAVLEVHPFVSCGLYGFYDERIPDMLEAGIDWYVHNP